MGRQYQLPKPVTPIGGLVQSFVLPVSQSPAVVSQTQQARGPWTHLPWNGTEAAPTNQLYAFAPPTVPVQRSYGVRPKVASFPGTIQPQTSPIPGVTAQPDRGAWWAPRRSTELGAHPELNIAAVVTATGYEGFSLSLQRQRTQDWRIVADPKPPILAATAAVRADVFKAFDNPIGYDQRPAPRLFIRSIRGPAPSAPNAPVVTDQPTWAWWTMREAIGAVIRSSTAPRLDQGATRQATYLYPTNQPELIGYTTFRQQPARIPNTEGVTTQPSFVFTFTQPDRGSYYIDRRASRVEPEKQTLGVFTPPAAAQSYVFEPGQPSRSFWYRPSVPTLEVLPVPQFTGARVQSVEPQPSPVASTRNWVISRASVTATDVEAWGAVTSTSGATVFRRTLFKRVGSRGQE